MFYYMAYFISIITNFCIIIFKFSAIIDKFRTVDISMLVDHYMHI